MRIQTASIFGMCLYLIPSAFANVPSALEPDFAEAVLAYNGKDYNVALKMLDNLLGKAPDSKEFLELKALTLKTIQDAEGAAKIYRQLIMTKKKEKAPNTERAPYHFELGVMDFKNEKFEMATKHLEFAAENDFNVAAANFFLGLIDFKLTKWESAEKHFQAVVASETASLHPASHFYLGQVYLKLKFPSASTHHFNLAKKSAQKIIQDKESNEEGRKVAQQIYDSADKALEPLNKGQFFGNIALLTAYDTNVLAMPASQESNLGSGKKSIKEMIQFGVGYMSSPLKAIQLVPNYRMSYNYNFNRASQHGEYLTNILSLYATRSPLAPFHYGAKIEGNHTFQNKVEDTADTRKFGSYGPFSATASIGPYARWYARPKHLFGTEFTYQRQVYFEDDTKNRTGNGLRLQLYYHWDRGHRFLNPLLSLAGSTTGASSPDYRSKAGTVGLTNYMNLSDRLKMSTQLECIMTKYDDANRSMGSRTDLTPTAALTAQYRLSGRLTFLGEARYSFNTSKNSTNPQEEEQWEYKRFVLSAGVSYSIF